MKSEWQPIETAPRDGTVVLLCCKEWIITGAIHQGINAWVNNGPNYCQIPSDEQPTHWMPLPRACGNADDIEPVKSDVNLIQAQRYRALRAIASMPNLQQEMLFAMLDKIEPIGSSGEMFDKRVIKLIEILGWNDD
jgi:hypothetical protein